MRGSYTVKSARTGSAPGFAEQKTLPMADEFFFL
jgi:hypothetical protein